VPKDRRRRLAEELLSHPEHHHFTAPFVALEAENRLRVLESESSLKVPDSHLLIPMLERILTSGLIISPKNLKESRLIAAEGRRLIRHFSTLRPHKTMDLIHVACARMIKAEAFFTFDANQSALAEAAGFRVSLF
jgi:hypothetical protein